MYKPRHQALLYSRARLWLQRHWEYQSFDALQVPEEQHVGPVHPDPPHWPYKAAHEPLPPEAGVVVAGGFVSVVTEPEPEPEPGLLPLAPCRVSRPGRYGSRL